MSGRYSAQEQEIKFRKFIKLRIRAEYEPGWSPSKIQKTIGISKETFKRWVEIDDNEEQYLSLPPSGGRNRATTSKDDRVLEKVMEENPFSSIRAIRERPEIATNLNLSMVSDSTIVRRLNERGLVRRVAAVKERFEQRHIDRRFEYAQDYSDWTFEEWSFVIYIDEFRVSSGDDGRVYVWRRNGTRYELANLRHVNRVYRFDLSFIVSFSFHGLGPIRIVNTTNQYTYRDYLQEDLLPYIDQHYDDGYVFLLQDNHPAHRSNTVKEWIDSALGSHELFVLPHPPLSPDLNPCENVGNMIKWMIRSKTPILDSQESVRTALNEAYEELKENKQFFINLVASMERRIEAVLRVQGGHTKY